MRSANGIGSVRRECLDHMLIVSERHLRRKVKEYVPYFNHARPHQGLDQQIPVPKVTHKSTGPVGCRTVLGGILHDYYRDAA